MTEPNDSRSDPAIARPRERHPRIVLYAWRTPPEEAGSGDRNRSPIGDWRETGCTPTNAAEAVSPA